MIWLKVFQVLSPAQTADRNALQKIPKKLWPLSLLPDQLHTAHLTRALTEDGGAWQITFYYLSDYSGRGSGIVASEMLQFDAVKL